MNREVKKAMNKKRLLLHACCAPCLSQCLNVLSGSDAWEKVLRKSPDFYVSLYFDNPNIFPGEEYGRRKGELNKIFGIFSGSGIGLSLLEDSSVERRSMWDEAVRNFHDEPEKGRRCELCYSIRLEETFRKAREGLFDAVATSLTLSPWKDAEKINAIGWQLSKNYGTEYIESDFKKNDGYRKSAYICSKFGIYRQNYCGCRFSKPRHTDNLQTKAQHYL